ncbi:hypothetical protein BDW22DRAFT_1346217 [Trametopsis cervina]|nr:hypothetical protein BDW22DRAFT_1346217 [Trametopsis cervina]
MTSGMRQYTTAQYGTRYDDRAAAIDRSYRRQATVCGEGEAEGKGVKLLCLGFAFTCDSASASMATSTASLGVAAGWRSKVEPVSLGVGAAPYPTLLYQAGVLAFCPQGLEFVRPASRLAGHLFFDRVGMRGHRLPMLLLLPATADEHGSTLASDGRQNILDGRDTWLPGVYSAVMVGEDVRPYVSASRKESSPALLHPVHFLEGGSYRVHSVVFSHAYARRGLFHEHDF